MHCKRAEDFYKLISDPALRIFGNRLSDRALNRLFWLREPHVCHHIWPTRARLRMMEGGKDASPAVVAPPRSLITTCSHLCSISAEQCERLVFSIEDVNKWKAVDGSGIIVQECGH